MYDHLFMAIASTPLAKTLHIQYKYYYNYISPCLFNLKQNIFSITLQLFCQTSAWPIALIFMSPYNSRNVLQHQSFLSETLSNEFWKNSSYKSDIKTYHNNNNDIEIQPIKCTQFSKRTWLRVVSIYQNQK